MLEVRRTCPIDAHDSPPIRHRTRSRPTDIHHRLDRDREPRLQAYPPFRLAVIRHLWIFMESNTDSVTDEITHHTESRRLDDTLYCRTNVTNVVLGRRRFDSCGKRLLRHVQQSFRFGIYRPNRYRRRRIGIVAIQLHADVDGDDVSFLDNAFLRRNAVHDLLVDRRANARREIVQSLEGRGRTRMRPAEIVGNLVEVTGRHARSDAPFEQSHGRRENLASPRHDLDLAR